jgi:hypothetical protein
MPVYIVAVFFQVFCKMVDSAALTGAMSNQNDLICRQQVLRNLLVKRFFLRHSLATVMRFLPVNKVRVKTEAVVGAGCLLWLRDFCVQVPVHVRSLMINHHHDPTGHRSLFRATGVWVSINLLSTLTSEIRRETSDAEILHFVTPFNSSDTATLILGTRHAPVKSGDDR